MFIKPLAALFVLVILAAACSGGDDSANESPDPAPTEAAADPAPTVSTEPTAVPTTAPTPAPPTDQAGDAWEAMWNGAELLVSDPITAETQITAVASEAVFDQLDTIFAPTVAGDTATTARTFTNHPVVVADGDGAAIIDDCVQVSPPDTAPFVWFAGVARPEGGSWIIESIEPKALGGCVPGEIAQPAIEGYEAYWDARAEFWDPADPDHPLVTGTLTGPQLDVIRNLLIDHQQRGLVLRGRPETNPEVVQIASPTELTILDCMIQDPDRGVYVAETGERTDDIAPVVDGQRDLRSTVMVLEDGVWKVSDIQGQANVRCDTAPTVQGLPSV